MAGPISILKGGAAFSLFIPLLLHFTIFITCSANAQPDYITWCNKTPRPIDCQTLAINNNTSSSKTGRKLSDKHTNHQQKGGEHKGNPVKQHQNRVVVAQDGSGNYKSIQEAVNAAGRRPVNARFEIYVKKGRYNEPVKVEGPNFKDITIVGDGIGNTIITGDKHVQSKHQHTSETATFSVKAPGFIAKFITFANTAGPGGHQAVALKSDSNQSVYYKCSFEGYQDTLYLYPGLQFFRECDITGSMDTIFGDSTAVFQKCNILLKKHVGNEVIVTAQKRGRDDNTGFVIQNSRVTLNDELKKSHGVKVYLGRPWGRYSRTVYIRTYLGQGINPQGWTYMDEIKDGNFVDYAEFENTGPGSNTAGRIKWRGVKNINRNEASKFTVRNFLQGGSWIASAGVPYNLDL